MSASVMPARSFRSAPAQNARSPAALSTTTRMLGSAAISVQARVSSPAIAVLTEFIASGRLSMISATPSPGCCDTLFVSISVQASGSGLVPLVTLEPALFLLHLLEQRSLHELHPRDIGQHDLAVLTRRLHDQPPAAEQAIERPLGERHVIDPRQRDIPAVPGHNALPHLKPPV